MKPQLYHEVQHPVGRRDIAGGQEVADNLHMTYSRNVTSNDFHYLAGDERCPIKALLSGLFAS